MHGREPAQECPCGDLGRGDRPCRCTPGLVAQFRGRVSGPVLDRFDLQMEVLPCRPATCAREGGRSRRLLERALARLGLSARAHDGILRVARTIADLDGSDEVGAAHIAEAAQYRAFDRGAARPPRPPAMSPLCD